MSQDPTWLDALSPAPASEVPTEFLAALRRRRHERRLRIAGSVAVVLAATATLVMLDRSGAIPAASERPIAERPSPVGSLRAWEQPIEGEVRVAFIYGQGELSDLDRLARSSPAGEDRQMRIGDHWDPERVRAWVVD